MTAKHLVHDRYGKRRIHLTWIDRGADTDRDPHTLRQLVLDIALEGDFAASYLTGDNRSVIATDSMRNTVYVLARERGIASLEGFARALAEHLTATYPQVVRATVDAEERPWQRIAVDGTPHSHAFVSGSGLETAQARACRGSRTRVTSGLEGLGVLKTADSAFSEFVSDRFRTLGDADDRLFATSITAHWERGEDTPGDDASWPADRVAIRDALLTTFANHHSLAVQHTLHAMGCAALDAAPEIAEITLVLPNQHHLLVDLAPFGLDNPNRIFAGTDEPYGCIEGTIRREAVPADSDDSDDSAD